MIFPDTDIMVDILRQHPPAVAWLESHADEEIGLSGFVAMELIQGSRTRADQRRVQRWIRGYKLLWPAEHDCDDAFSVFASLHLSHSLGLLDALIAQQAVSLGVPLATFNVKHYAGVPGLQIMQPYSRE